ncbi:coenzyme Q-binding protein COQ10 homolog B, mitochondrial [Apis florea]|uniref:Coenzyme Q-binding protein COQ10 homolog B, mitochondrial n=1 Tax=Apis mellifera TaxID=7460 RepID=A0A7M7FYC0_APIME|nr:coenzyme Q-binding protein COQ10 homolog B, mitochondrial [Apis mellifera]XP_003698636.2 coenzyme Q-binding protein COQ10 homolog B, mitochondrial [Apis florea]|eukprot:XP_001120956.3 coenzyme Q-binding protein COQ10 homolog B, mitochondrial [Apis mellifera]
MYRRILLFESAIFQNKCNFNKQYIERMYMADIMKTKEYEGRKLIGFSMDQIYSVVADVQNYKEFVPFCKKSDVIFKSDDMLKANLVIGFPPINESYTSIVTTMRPHLVKAECSDGRLFNHLNTLWLFSPGLKNNAQTCVIDFSLSFEFKSIIYSHLSNLFFNEIVRQMENAFIDEAKRRYGRPCIKTVRLER